MKKLKAKIEITISDINVSADGYYDFLYKIVVNGVTKKGKHNSDFSGQTASHFKKVLENGFALELAMDKVSFR